eukprot:CAMPEP_0177583838 /NCGR_PEP_ID=MMETSP0419_2-20121207/3549_1 /TAXON_ID=582737 /ORGANISM="Tetraselmis sp., Strain GSL018" /LENGTH=782 /DNA_ID=CAMNT_0019073283 /DNA_START=341 /DNA_END=2685 /DNA_ORIENTATION=-
MTIGIDMSSLFTQMVLACSNEDLVLKKMLYQYIQSYASYHPDNVLLTINTLQKDCQDVDPKLRGLALRTLCSLRVANLLEYLVSPLKAGLDDAEAYVRRTAVMGVYKVYHLDSDVVHDQGFADRIYAMLFGDSDRQVTANCLEVLIGMEGVAKICTKEVVYHVLNDLRLFSEWAQCQVMDFVSHYRPEDEDEIFEIMNVLEDRMTHSNSAVVLAVCKLYLHITLSMPATHQQVLERIKSPLLTLLGNDSAEVAYAVLSHLHLLISRAPVLFSEDYKDFFCKFSDATYIKKLKMEILTAIANTNTAYEICTELSEYINYGNASIAREAVRSVGRIALEVPDVPGICDRLLSFLDANMPHVTAETLCIIKDLLRRFPERAEECIAAVSGMAPMDVDEPEARAAFIWLLGEYGREIQDAPYLLEAVAEAFADQTAFVQLVLLTSSMKLFFQRPPECQRLLGAVLKGGMGDVEQDVQDRALMYYRLLQHSAEAAQRVVCPTIPVVSAFAEEQSAELRDKIFDEFNTLSVILRAPASTFLDKDMAHHTEHDELVDGAAEEQAATAEAGLLDQNGGGLLDESTNSQVDEGPSGGASAGGGGAPASSDPLVSLLDLDEALAAAPAGPPPPPPAPALELDPQPSLDPATFQGKWGQLQAAVQRSEQLPGQAVACALGGRLPQHMAAHKMQCMAHGGAAPNLKYYFFAKKDGTAEFFLIEAVLKTDAARVDLVIKADDGASSEAFAGKLLAALMAALVTAPSSPPEGRSTPPLQAALCGVPRLKGRGGWVQ